MRLRGGLKAIEVRAAIVALVIGISSLLLGSFMNIGATTQEQLDISIRQNSSAGTNSIPAGILVPNYPCAFENIWFLDEEHPNFFGADEPISDCIYGSSVTDYIDGDSGNDYLYGRDDNDVIYGASGNDRIEGDVGADFLRGGSENDTIYGGINSDLIQNEEGLDILFGEDGDDEFINGPDIDEFNCGAGFDVIWSLPVDSEDVVNDDCEYRTPNPKPNCPPGFVVTLPPLSVQPCMPSIIESQQ